MAGAPDPQLDSVHEDSHSALCVRLHTRGRNNTPEFEPCMVCSVPEVQYPEDEDYYQPQDVTFSLKAQAMCLTISQVRVDSQKEWTGTVKVQAPTASFNHASCQCGTTFYPGKDKEVDKVYLAWFEYRFHTQGPRLCVTTTPKICV